jgi:hypothetical protein
MLRIFKTFQVDLHPIKRKPKYPQGYCRFSFQRITKHERIRMNINTCQMFKYISINQNIGGDMEDSFVKIMKCRFCGNQTNSIALHKRLRPIKGDVFDTEPCDRCKELFKTHKYFIGDCGHSGFIKIEALKRALNEDAYKRIENAKIFRIKKCFACLSDHPIDSFEKLQ